MIKEDLRILIADDNENLRESLKDILGDVYEKAVICLVADGDQAVEKIKEEQFDILFIDVRMPGMDGLQTIKKIREIRPSSTIVLMTGYSVEDLIEEARKEGVYTVLCKPLDATKIIEIIDEALGKPMILVVDDLPHDREVLADILEDKGYHVIKAESGYRAIELVKEKRFGLIFMDVKMPGIDGVATFLEVMKVSPQVPVVMMTGYQAEYLIDKALKYGACMCLYKPFQIEDVLKVAEKVLQSK